MGRTARTPARAGARRDVRQLEPAGGKDNQGWQSPSQRPRQPHTAPAEHRCYFQELFFNTELKRDLALAWSLSGKRSLYCRRVYFSKAGDMSRQGRCPGAMLPTPGAVGAELSCGGFGGRRLSPGHAGVLTVHRCGFYLGQATGKN